MKRLAGPDNEKHVFASVQYLRKKLIEKYGEEEIGFANMSNRSDVFYFKKKTLFDRIIHNSLLSYIKPKFIIIISSFRLSHVIFQPIQLFRPIKLLHFI